MVFRIAPLDRSRMMVARTPVFFESRARDSRSLSSVAWLFFKLLIEMSIRHCETSKRYSRVLQRQLPVP